MGLVDRLRSSQIIAGPVGYFGLGEWWLAMFTEADRKHIESSSSSPTGGGPLTEGQISYSSGTAAQFLSSLATNFYKPRDRRIARLMLSKAEKLAKKTGNVLDLHFAYAGMIKTFYADRDNDPEALNSAIVACEEQIALAPKAAETWKLEYPGEPLPGHAGYTQHAIIQEKQKKFAAALSLSRFAMEQGWAGDWEHRIARNERNIHRKRSG